MPNNFYNPSGYPATRSPGTSLNMRAELLLVQAGFDKLPTLTGNGSKLLRVNAGGTAIESFTHDFLTASVAASTYQTSAGMSAYLTAASAAATYQPLSGMGSYLTSASAAATYLTQANAASTYQTSAGMSSYLTTSSAASTYLPLSGGTMTSQLLSAVGAVGSPGVAFAGDTNTGMWSPSLDVIAWSNAGVESMRLDSAGNLRLAGAPSAWGSAFRAVEMGDAAFGGGGGAARMVNNAYFDGSNWRYKTTNAVVAVQAETSGLAVYVAASGSAGTIATLNPAFNINTSGVATYTIDGASPEIGFRVVPRFPTAGQTAAVAQRGRCYATTGGITVPASTFAAGDCFSIYNNSASAVTITQGAALTMYGPNAATGNRTLAARGMCTVWFNSSTDCKITGEIT